MGSIGQWGKMVYTGACGSAIITAGKTAVSVIHNLKKTPLCVHVSPNDDLSGRTFWSSSVTAYTLVINISSKDIVDHKLYWSVE
jgi:hypothetical protein